MSLVFAVDLFIFGFLTVFPEKINKKQNKTGY